MRSIIVASILTILAHSATAQWRYKFTPGETLKYNVTANMEMTTSQGGQDMTMQNDATQSLELSVESVDANAISIVTKPSAMKIHMNVPMMGDTTMELKELENRRTRSVVSPTGKQLKPPTLLDTGAITDPMVAQVSRSMEHTMNVLHELPAETVAKGGTWTLTKNDTSDVEQGKVYTVSTMKGTYVRDCDTLGHSCAVLAYTIDLKLEGAMKIQNMFDATITGDGTGKGTVYFDAARGKMLANVNVMEMNQQIAVTGQQSMVIPQTMTTKTNMSIVE